jgi:hypothetical protein
MSTHEKCFPEELAFQQRFLRVFALEWVTWYVD